MLRLGYHVSTNPILNETLRTLSLENALDTLLTSPFGDFRNNRSHTLHETEVCLEKRETGFGLWMTTRFGGLFQFLDDSFASGPGAAKNRYRCTLGGIEESDTSTDTLKK